MKDFGHRKLLCEFSKLSKLNAFILLGYQANTDAPILVYKFHPERTGLNRNQFLEIQNKIAKRNGCITNFCDKIFIMLIRIA